METMHLRTTVSNNLRICISVRIIRLITAYRGASKPLYSYILSGIAIFILLIACINFVNLTVARSVRRAKEIGVRKVIGGERRQLIFQFLGESFFLCFIAFIFAIVLVQLVLPVFNQLSNKALALSYLFDAKLISGLSPVVYIDQLACRILSCLDACLPIIPYKLYIAGL